MTRRKFRRPDPLIFQAKGYADLVHLEEFAKLIKGYCDRSPRMPPRRGFEVRLYVFGRAGKRARFFAKICLPDHLWRQL